jgi:hypothetical protein
MSGELDVFNARIVGDFKRQMRSLGVESVLDYVMPNGKKFRDCTFEEARALILCISWIAEYENYDLNQKIGDVPWAELPYSRIEDGEDDQ